MLGTVPAFFTLLAQISIILILISLFTNQVRIIKFLGKNAVLLSFLIAASATVGSLLYSEIIGFEPCKLCWYQRVFMYPQAILFGVASWKKDEIIAPRTGLALSLFGGAISLYQYLLQMGVVQSSICPALGTTSSCAQILILEFGYITLPMMALTIFFLISIIMFVKIKNERLNKENR